jgi:hypothetical protein
MGDGKEGGLKMKCVMKMIREPNIKVEAVEGPSIWQVPCFQLELSLLSSLHIHSFYYGILYPIA